MLEVARIAAILTAAVFQTGFVAIYMTRPWWRHFVGRALFTKSAALMLLIDTAVLNIATDYRGEEVVEVALYWFVAAAIIFQFGALLAQIYMGRRTS